MANKPRSIVYNIANRDDNHPTYKHLRDCRIRHYRNMELSTARKILSELKTKKQKDDFIKRINACKQYEFIK